MRNRLGLLFLCLTLVVWVHPVLADGDIYVVMAGGGVGVKISSLPYTISSPGFYYVTGNLNCSSGHGITVNADDVTIDLMGFRLSGNVNSMGIYLSGRHNVEIRNGTLCGWSTAIMDSNVSATNHRVINVRAEGNLACGIYLSGYSHLVKGCAVLNNPGDGISANCSIITGNQIYNCGAGILSALGTISNNAVSKCANQGIFGTGTISGNTLYDCGTAIYCGNAGSLIGNCITLNSGQTGIYLSTDIDNPNMVDQNTVHGPGTHSSGGSAATVWGKNAGLP